MKTVADVTDKIHAEWVAHNTRCAIGLIRSIAGLHATKAEKLLAITILSVELNIIMDRVTEE